jgi:hypothetical protein
MEEKVHVEGAWSKEDGGKKMSYTPMPYPRTQRTHSQPHSSKLKRVKKSIACPFSLAKVHCIWFP